MSWNTFSATHVVYAHKDAAARAASRIEPLLQLEDIETEGSECKGSLGVLQRTCRSWRAVDLYRFDLLAYDKTGSFFKDWEAVFAKFGELDQ